MAAAAATPNCLAILKTGQQPRGGCKGVGEQAAYMPASAEDIATRRSETSAGVSEMLAPVCSRSAGNKKGRANPTFLTSLQFQCQYIRGQKSQATCGPANILRRSPARPMRKHIEADCVRNKFIMLLAAIFLPHQTRGPKRIVYDLGDLAVRRGADGGRPRSCVAQCPFYRG